MRDGKMRLSIAYGMLGLWMVVDRREIRWRGRKKRMSGRMNSRRLMARVARMKSRATFWLGTKARRMARKTMRMPDVQHAAFVNVKLEWFSRK